MRIAKLGMMDNGKPGRLTSYRKRVGTYIIQLRIQCMGRASTGHGGR